MRKFGYFLLSGSVMLVAVAWVDGQGPGGFGGFGPKGSNTPLDTLVLPEVKKELNISEAQLEKLSPEVLAAIKNVLEPGQFKRFKQIDIQKRGNNAFKDEAIQKDLKINDKQKQSIIDVLEDSNKALADLSKGGFMKKGNQEKSENIRKEAKEKIFEILTKDQRVAYREMVGEEFKFQQFGGGFPKKDGGGTDKKKADK